MRFRLILPILLGTLAISLGCGGPKAASDDFYDLTGSVTVNGKPADRISMTFTPLEAGKGREDVCLVTAGKYTTKLMAAKYKVSFFPVNGGTPIPKQFQRAETTTQEADATKNGQVNFDLR